MAECPYCGRPFPQELPMLPPPTYLIPAHRVIRLWTGFWRRGMKG